MNRCLTILLLAAVALTGGCSMSMRRTLENTGSNQVVRVESGDRLLFELEEEPDCLWDASCADSDVDVTIDHKKGKAKVEIRIFRGYDGPSTVVFVCRPEGKGEPKQKFTLSLFRRTGDTAFWK